MHLECREYLIAAFELLLEFLVMIGRYESLVCSLVEDIPYSFIEIWFYLSLDIELLSVDVTEGPYKQVLIELQTGSRCVVRIEVGLIDYQSKRAPFSGAFTKKECRRFLNLEI